MSNLNDEKYVKLTHKEHVLLRPDMYIGSNKSDYNNIFISSQIRDIKNANIIYQRLNYNPAFLKLFDEILINASDQSIRTNQVKYIKIQVNKDHIIIENDGPGIPVEIHKKHNIYIPELIFGHLLTGENYKDTGNRFTGGKNGLGATLVNIYSKKFIVETSDGKKKYYQEFENNLDIINKAKIRKFTSKQYTRITYYPDFDKFDGVDEISEQIQQIFLKRVFDIAIYCPNVKVYYNNELVLLKNFKSYIEKFTNNKKEIFTEKINDNWEVGITKSLSDTFMQNSIVNGVYTIVGGSHVNLISNKIVKEIKENLEKKFKKTRIKLNDIKSRLFLFVNCKIADPDFDTQTKENLITKITDKFEISQNTIKKVLSSSILEEIIDLIILKQQQEAKRKLRADKVKRIRIKKLQDANKAGTNESEKCSLFLTEGDSAKSTAVEGFSVVGRDYFGAFPLKGKLLNVRDVGLEKMQNNDEIKNIISALGLEFGRKYKSVKDLRYGKLVIMTDSDHDGSHIKGLIINLFDTYWKELLKLDFIYEFVTPIIKASKGKEVKYFYRLNEYQNWKENTDSNLWFIKYYKGLGTIENFESELFFKNIKKHLIKYNYDDEKITEDKIDMLFRKNRVNDRKAWLETYKPNNYFDKFSKKTTYNTFIDTEMIEFSMADNIRSIPSMVDGLKPSQRKVLYTLFKKNYKNEVKVSLFSGAVTQISAYHHSPMSLEQTIVGMAQTFINSNNINLLEPKGQFGTRTHGGEDSSASRYLFTKLNKIVEKIFIKIDENILKYLDDDGFNIEPEYYLPIVPMILVNGAKGIGSAYSSDVPKFNIKDIINYLKIKLSNRNPQKDLKPYYNNFKGIIEDIDNNKFITRGIYRKINDNEIQITELPIGVWTENYHIYLDKLIDKKIIKDYIKYSNNKDINIIVIFNKGELLKLEKSDSFYKTMLLETTLSYNNMMLFDKDLKLKKYNNVKEILNEFYDIRLDFYSKRKKYILAKYEYDKMILLNKIKFIRLLLDDKIILKNKKKSILIQELETFNLKKIDDGYDYLLNLKFINLTNEKLHEIKDNYDYVKNKIKQINEKTIKNMWLDDLNDLIKTIR